MSFQTETPVQPQVAGIDAEISELSYLGCVMQQVRADDHKGPFRLLKSVTVTQTALILGQPNGEANAGVGHEA